MSTIAPIPQLWVLTSNSGAEQRRATKRFRSRISSANYQKTTGTCNFGKVQIQNSSPCPRHVSTHVALSKMTSWVLFPRLHLAEIEDQSWCPSWLREHTHRALARMWQTSNSKNGSPATQACDLLLRALGGPEVASKFTFVDACAGAGGPTPLLEKNMNERLTASGYKPVDFVLTDLWPDLKAWEAIAKRSEHISFIREPVDATKPRRMAKPGTKECRIFNLCFHHFKDDAAQKVLSSAVQSTDAFM